MEHFSELPQTDINASTEPCPLHAVFYYYLSDHSKQDAATTTVHRNCLIELLKSQKTDVSTKYNMGKY